MKKVKTEEAAAQLGMSVQALRMRMISGSLPIGIYGKLRGEKFDICIWQEWIDNYAKYGPKWQEMNLYKEHSC